ncbi:MAG: SCP2 sterol-binding domain-containing protein [Methylophilaceae bacterium]|nr:SCP2 sterol-binding domain-containing protein [Methylophilaceae bacterium]
MEILSIAALALNHVLRQSPWAAEKLRPHAGRTVRLALLPFEALFTVSPEGEFQPARPDATAEAAIILTPTTALRLLADQPPDPLFRVEGDTTLAMDISKVLHQLRWEYEEDLSHLIGDIPAHELVTLGKRIMSEGQRQLGSLAATLAEYWLEERPLIAKRRHLEQFSREVDALRDDVERLAKRMEKLDRNP